MSGGEAPPRSVLASAARLATSAPAARPCGPCAISCSSMRQYRAEHAARQRFETRSADSHREHAESCSSDLPNIHRSCWLNVRRPDGTETPGAQGPLHPRPLFPASCGKRTAAAAPTATSDRSGVSSRRLPNLTRTTLVDLFSGPIFGRDARLCSKTEDPRHRHDSGVLQ